MNYALEIREHNQRPHLDIEEDMQKQKNGQFTFILRINNGNIVDYQVIEHADIRDYLVLKKIVIEELTVPHVGGERSQENPIRPDNSKREDQGRDSGDNNGQYSQSQTEEVPA